MLIELNYLQNYQAILQEKEEEIKFSFDQYSTYEDVKFSAHEHTEAYAKQWVDYNKISSKYVDITKLIQERNIAKLEEALSSSAISINSYHVGKAIDMRSSEISKLLLENYKDEIYEFQIFDLIKENNLELIKMLLPYIPEISSYSLNAAIKNENIDILKLLLSEHKGNLYEYQLFSVTNQEIIEIVKNHPNYEPTIPVNSADLENTDQQLAGVVQENSSDFYNSLDQ